MVSLPESLLEERQVSSVDTEQTGGNDPTVVRQIPPSPPGTKNTYGPTIPSECCPTSVTFFVIAPIEVPTYVL